jgi:hypothetical protein
MLARANATGSLATASSFEEALIDAVRSLGTDVHPTPMTYAVAAIRFLQQAVRSNLRNTLVPTIAAWQRIVWTRIVVSETFRLQRPARTVPDIKAALSLPDDDERFLGTLVLAAANAVGATLPHQMQIEFAALAAKPAVE